MTRKDCIMDQTDRYAIELRGIDKRFGEVYANKQIDLQVQKGSIHGIVGENGAGKSTLMSILYGYYQADSGAILLDGAPSEGQGLLLQIFTREEIGPRGQGLVQPPCGSGAAGDQ